MSERTALSHNGHVYYKRVMTDSLGYCQKMAGVYLVTLSAGFVGHHNTKQEPVMPYPDGRPSQLLYSQLMIAPGQCRAAVLSICAW